MISRKGRVGCTPTETPLIGADRAQFEKDEAVIVRVVFRVAEPNLVSGLWFNK